MRDILKNMIEKNSYLCNGDEGEIYNNMRLMQEMGYIEVVWVSSGITGSVLTQEVPAWFFITNEGHDFYESVKYKPFEQRF